MEDKLLMKKNLIWVLARMQHATKQIITIWTGFNLIAGNFLINALATSLANIHEMLCRNTQIKYN